MKIKIPSIPRPYYYIEPCPKCNSRRTGYIRRDSRQSSEIEYESLKHGEIVRFAMQEPRENAFCVECGHRWPYTPRLMFWSSERIQEEIDARGTEEAYMELREYRKEETKSKKGSKLNGLRKLIFGR